MVHAHCSIQVVYINFFWLNIQVEYIDALYIKSNDYELPPISIKKSLDAIDLL